MHLEDLDGEAQIVPGLILALFRAGNVQTLPGPCLLQCPSSVSVPGGAVPVPSIPTGLGSDSRLAPAPRGLEAFEGVLSRKSSLFALLFPLGLKLLSLGWKHGMFVKFTRAFRETFRKNILSLLL